MVELKSKASAQDSLRHCLKGIPALCWANFDGEMLAEILGKLEGNTKNYSHPKLESLRNRTKRDLERPDRAPTRASFLATWLTQDRDYIDDWVLKALRRRNLGAIARWHARDRKPPTRGGSDAAWEAWAESITATLWPTKDDLQQALSPAQLEFRETILRIEVIQVIPSHVRWHIPSLDVNSEREVLQNARSLDHLFKQHTGGLQMKDISAKIDDAEKQLSYSTRTQLAPPNAIAPRQTVLSSSESTRTTSTLSARHPDARASRLVPEPTGTQFLAGASTFAPTRGYASKTPSQQLLGLIQVRLSDSAPKFYPPEVMRDTENIIRGLALHLDTVNKLVDKAKHLLDTTLDERRKLEHLEKKAMRTKFRLTWHLDHPAGSEEQDTISGSEILNDRLCGQLRQKLAECRERETFIQGEKQRTERMRERLMKVYVEFVDEHIRGGVLERQGQ